MTYGGWGQSTLKFEIEGGDSITRSIFNPPPFSAIFFVFCGEMFRGISGGKSAESPTSQ